MTRQARRSSSSSSWYSLYLLLFVLVAPLALLTPASAKSDEQTPLREDLGDGD